MTEEASKIANSFGMWAICTPMVLIMLFQAYIFMKKAWEAGQKMGLSKDKMKQGLRTAAITSIGPGFSILISLVGLIAIVGSAIGWLRLSVIGAMMFEGLAASEALGAMGTAVGDPGFDLTALANIVWVMAIASGGWILLTGLFTHKLDSIRLKIVGGKTDLLPVFTIAAVLGAFGYQVSKHALTISRSTIAVIVSALVMVLLNYISKKTGKRWIREWALGFCMLVGMFASVIGL